MWLLIAGEEWSWQESGEREDEMLEPQALFGSAPIALTSSQNLFLNLMTGSLTAKNRAREETQGSVCTKGIKEEALEK